MTRQIAVAGKGGTGKTTFTSLLIRYLIEKKKGPILAVDADPNANLNEALGLKLGETISEVIARTKSAEGLPAGMTQETFIQYKLQSALVETKDVDLLVMGGPDGPGCYCFPNNILRKHLENLSDGYNYTIMDNEAGMEHISRRVTSAVDILFIVSDTSARGIRSAGRVHSLVRSLSSRIKEIYLIVTKNQTGDLEALQAEIAATGLTLIGVIPYDACIVRYDLESKPLFDLPEDSPAVTAVNAICDKVNL
ncbi:AAA family ATPase [Acetonema longum]|uniref:Cobyrinic acid a,c-diamide synthase n=1 Tax=Acetonema longum DSM 6540 TaxID=1009370 RepID=F7NGT0_9FIRM|nr:AAA family ATPase [Acetonema longum]EGO64661.1 cobyrinic acid a,c-diamide synthase [Acetonema longum DSM 6540]